MDHRGKTLFPGDGVTLGWDLNIRLDGRTLVDFTSHSNLS